MNSFIIDLHVHSHYSRATSKHSTLEGLYLWGKIKGINVIGTGDFTHPLWFNEITEKLQLGNDGLYILRDDIASHIDKTLPINLKKNSIKFIPTAEICNIYTKSNKLRKIHNLVIVPTLQVANELNQTLNALGNLQADGRPILGLDSKDLLKLVLHVDKKTSLFIPAHVWTPWFGLFGSKSGFDSIQQAFEELSSYIYAVETGLSSDPFMNWRCMELQSRTIISNSDAHSPQKLGREATVIKGSCTYENIIEAIKRNDDRLGGTIEFFPQEGKYHFDGHRTCGVRMSPTETKACKGICPVCGRQVTKGVDYRVGDIATHNLDYRPLKHKRVEYIVPLIEIISEIKHVSSKSKKAQAEYMKIISSFGTEFDILRNIPTGDIDRYSLGVGDLVNRMREGKIYIEPGYDGVYGKVKLFKNE